MQSSVANARGEQIILMDDEELITEPNTMPVVKQPINANEYRPNRVDIKTNNPAKSKNQKKVATKQKSSGKKPTTGENAIISKLEFKQANMMDVARALADMSGLNIVTTEAAAKKNVTVFLQNITVKNALDIISKNSGLWYRYDKTAKNYRVMTTEEYQSDLVIYRDDVTKVFDILHPNPLVIANAIKDLYGFRVRFVHRC